VDKLKRHEKLGVSKKVHKWESMAKMFRNVMFKNTEELCVHVDVSYFCSFASNFLSLGMYTFGNCMCCNDIASFPNLQMAKYIQNSCISYIQKYSMRLKIEK